VSPVPEEELSSTTQDDIPHTLLKKLCRLVDVEGHAARYSDAICDCAFALHAISPKAYGFSRQVLPLPTPTTIVNHAINETWYVRNAIDGRGGVPLSTYLRDYRKRENICPDPLVPAVVGFDVTPVSATGIGHNWSNESCFTFMLLPLDHRLSGLVVQPTRYSSGKINQNIRDARDVLLRVIKANRFLSRFVATNGDSGMNGSHDAAFQKYATLNQSNLDSILHTLIEHGHKESED
jgi:hypothetical protein